MSEAPANGVPDDLSRLLEESGAEIRFSRPIDYGTQYRVTRGRETAVLNVYTSGKTSTGGRPSTLLDLLEDWRISRTSTGSERGTESPTKLDGTPRVGAD